MDAVTYPNDRVAEFLSEHTIPIKLQIDENQSDAKEYGMNWTPGLVWLDGEGSAHHSNVGYFEPDELIPECLLGAARVAAGTGNWDGANSLFTRIGSDWKDSHAAPAALYWQGVSAKMATDEVEPLLKNWKRLIETYPKSAWAMKVRFIED